MYTHMFILICEKPVSGSQVCKVAAGVMTDMHTYILTDIYMYIYIYAYICIHIHLYLFV